MMTSVGEQEITRAPVVDQHRRLVGVGGRDRMIAGPQQLGDHVVPHQRIVLDDENRLRASLYWHRHRRADRFDVVASGARKIDLDAGVMAILAIRAGEGERRALGGDFARRRRRYRRRVVENSDEAPGAGIALTCP
jgi:hypothetical protein